MQTYLPESWESKKITTRSSPLHGHGVFAVAPIAKGEVLVRWGGRVFTTQHVLDGATNDQTACQIDDDLYIAGSPDTKLIGSDLMNHSCDPNTWMDDEVTISARRDIAPGEEVTADYALWAITRSTRTLQRTLPSLSSKTDRCARSLNARIRKQQNSPAVFL